LTTKTFDQGLRELSERVGVGDLVGHVEIDQIYAHYQHEGLDLHHPRGGEAKYLERPLFENRELYFNAIAEECFGENGPKKGMERAVEMLSDAAELRSPFLWGDLGHSGHPFVEDDGVLVYDRPPKVHRLTEEELREKSRRSPLPPELLGYIWWHVMKKQHPPNYKGGA